MKRTCDEIERLEMKWQHLLWGIHTYIYIYIYILALLLTSWPHNRIFVLQQFCIVWLLHINYGYIESNSYTQTISNHGAVYYATLLIESLADLDSICLDDSLCLNDSTQT